MFTKWEKLSLLGVNYHFWRAMSGFGKRLFPKYVPIVQERDYLSIVLERKQEPFSGAFPSGQPGGKSSNKKRAGADDSN